VTTSAPRTARARARAELTDEIKQAARRQVVEEGAAALSLRAVARELGMVSSAVYRYFPSRDELLTALIIDAYDAVGAQVEAADAGVRPSDHLGRWLAATQAFRSWAVAHPQEYALIFGSPVPGYAAPRDTVDPAARVPLVLVGILVDAIATNGPPHLDDAPLPGAVRSDLRAFRLEAAVELTEPLLARAIAAWSHLVGTVSFELFGHLQNVIADHAAYFDFEMRRTGRALGLGR